MLPLPGSYEHVPVCLHLAGFWRPYRLLTRIASTASKVLDVDYSYAYLDVAWFG